MKNKKGYYIKFDNTKIDGIFAIFDEKEVLKVLNFDTKKFHDWMLNPKKEYSILKTCIFVNEQLYQYFRKRYLTNDVSKTAQADTYSLCLREDGSVSRVYKTDSKGSVYVLDNDGKWNNISAQTNGYQKSFNIDYETYKFIINECFVYSPEYFLRNLKFMSRNIVESDFNNKDFTDALFSNALNIQILPQSVRTKYPTVNHIKDFLFPKKYNPTTEIKFPFFGMDFGFTDMGAISVVRRDPLIDSYSIENLWINEAGPVSEGLFAQLERIRRDEVVDLKQLIPRISLNFEKKVEEKTKTKYQLSFPKVNLTGYDETITQVGYSRWEQREVASKLIFAIQEGKHLIVRNAENEIIAFYNKEQVSKMSFKFLKT